MTTIATTATAAADPATPTRLGPKPLFVVHRMEPGRLFTADCGALAGSRRFSTEPGTFVQNTAHYTLDTEQRYEGMVSCAVCLALGVGA